VCVCVCMCVCVCVYVCAVRAYVCVCGVRADLSLSIAGLFANGLAQKSHLFTEEVCEHA